jgi:predicted glycoside hydrolase/deacetylase ChbG (UPF0249 family)
MRRYLLGKIALAEISSELDAQIGKVVANGIKPSHLDGHQHLHVVPGVRRIIESLAKKYAIPAIRYPKERLRLYMLREKAGITRVPQLLALNAFCMFAGTWGAKRTDHFCGFFYGGKLTKENLTRVLEHLPPEGTCELMCHPGLDDLQSPYMHWGYRWQDELDALIDKDIRDYLKFGGVELISYADLAK